MKWCNKLILGLLLIGGLPVVVSAQVIAQVQPGAATASLTTTTCTGAPLVQTGCVGLNLGGYASVAVQLSGTWTGTVSFESQLDGTNWVAVNVVPSNGTTLVTTATGNGVWYATVIGAQFRARFSTATSGTVVVTIRSTMTSAFNLGGPSSIAGGACPAGQVETGVTAGTGAPICTATPSWTSGTSSQTALGTTSTDGIVLQNTTAATGGATVQISPRNKWCGMAWNSVGSASETDCWINENLPVTVAGATTSSLLWKYSIAGGTYAPALNLNAPTATEVLTLQVQNGGTLGAPAATEIDWFNYRASATDYESVRLQALPGNAFRVNVVATGNGVQRDIHFDASGAIRWWMGLDLGASAPFHPDGDNTQWIGNATHRIQTLFTGTDYLLGTSNAALCHATSPVRFSGFGTNADASFATGSNTCAFDLNIGTGGAPTSGVVTMPTITGQHGWICQMHDATTILDNTYESAYTATTVTIVTTVAWTANDHIYGNCMGF